MHLQLIGVNDRAFSGNADIGKRVIRPQCTDIIIGLLDDIHQFFFVFWCMNLGIKFMQVQMIDDFLQLCGF